MIPLAGVHIDGPHLHAMFARIADKLGGRIEPHGLAVQDRGGEHIGVIALQPGRAVDKQRERRRVAFGKAIGTEALDLAEAAFGEIAFVVLGEHAADELVLEGVDGANLLESGHGAPQLVGPRRLKSCCYNGYPHALFLEQRHP